MHTEIHRFVIFAILHSWVLEMYKWKLILTQIVYINNLIMNEDEKTIKWMFIENAVYSKIVVKDLYAPRVNSANAPNSHARQQG